VTAVGFLLIAVSLSVIGSVALWLRHRPPTSVESGIRAFEREMDALRPGERAERPPGGPTH
jgi:hypothetical protein